MDHVSEVYGWDSSMEDLEWKTLGLFQQWKEITLCFSRGKTKINGDSYRELNFG